MSQGSHVGCPAAGCALPLGHFVHTMLPSGALDCEWPGEHMQLSSPSTFTMPSAHGKHLRRAWRVPSVSGVARTLTEY
eukprot:460663-Prorocentrum_minimum.AAC.1